MLEKQTVILYRLSATCCLNFFLIHPLYHYLSLIMLIMSPLYYTLTCRISTSTYMLAKTDPPWPNSWATCNSRYLHYCIWVNKDTRWYSANSSV